MASMPKTLSKIPPPPKKKTPKPAPATARSRAPVAAASTVKSMPVDFRFTTGSPGKTAANDDDDDYFDDVAEAEEDVRGNIDFVVNDESPYSLKFINGGEFSAAMAVDLPLQVEARWSDTRTFDAKKKLQVWCQLPNGHWALGKIISSSSRVHHISSRGQSIDLKTECLFPANPEILDGVDDLTQLSYLHEPSVLYNLQYRYSQDVIYTKAGPVLVAINPFKEVCLYGNEYIEAYRSKSMSSPHVYTIADTAIREMIRDEINQSIIIRAS